jgi:porphobilinogen synthase
MWDAPTAAPANATNAARPRRLRRTPGIRRMLAEHELRVDQLIHPIFVRAGEGIDRPIASMPGHSQMSVDRLDGELEQLQSLGIGSVILFGLPSSKDDMGSEAWSTEGPVPRAIEAIKRRNPDMTVIADVCLCEYTDHGHCGILDASTHEISNDATLPLLARASVAYADAGADIVAPSAMMDNQVAAIRSGLDEAGHGGIAIISYAVKFASAFYGPFREAAESAPSFGDRRAYQMDPPNGREAMREAQLDADQGADVLMVKPAGPYLDIVHQIRSRFDLPVAAYQVSGEFAMLKAAAERGWIEERRAVLESLIGIRRAGADLIVTYYAKDVARWLRND